jgi:hypothetical protein
MIGNVFTVYELYAGEETLGTSTCERRAWDWYCEADGRGAMDRHSRDGAVVAARGTERAGGRGKGALVLVPQST